MKLHFKVGFIGAGNLATAIIKGLIEKKAISPQHIFVSNRTPGKLQKLSEQFQIQIEHTNEAVVEKADIVILAMKPQDLIAAVEPISSLFHDQQMIVSLAAGINFRTLEKRITNGRIARVMLNTPALINKGVIGIAGYDENDDGLLTSIEDLFSNLGMVIKMQSEDELDALAVASSAGTGFILELMSYWQDWLEEHGFDLEVAKKMTIETFVGTALLASSATLTSSLEDLQNKVTSKKGITAAGLESMRELEIERALRLSFEKANLRNQELAKIET
jgi:pyrroline-5-carboxylate reductase